MKPDYKDIQNAPGFKQLVVVNGHHDDVLAHNMGADDVFIFVRNMQWSAVPVGENSFKLIGPPDETLNADVLLIKVE